MESPFLKGLFDINIFWLAVRFLGALFGIMTLMSIGPSFIQSDYTGGIVLNDLLPVLAIWSFVMGMLLPLLVEFGLMEWLGTMAQKVMRLYLNCLDVPLLIPLLPGWEIIW